MQAAGRTSGLRARSARDAVAIWIVLAAIYLVFAGSASLNEALTAIGCASLGTLWWWVAGRRGGTRFRFGGGALRPLGAALLGLPRQTARVGLHLARAVLGRAGGGATAERTASGLDWATRAGETAPAARAVGILAASLAPDSFVLHLDRTHGTVALHAFEADGR